ncbi:MAG: nucleotidyltransferase domain-containing protein [Dehalococcoidia bacterium]|nr:nucleotidyltransferase domain-containing protein [Dehalococcoidia bacterium]
MTGDVQHPDPRPQTKALGGQTLPSAQGDTPLPAEVREVVERLIATLGDDLSAILWHGSYARGEAKPDSDHDLIIILKRIDDGVLLRAREVFSGRENWSTFVQSEEELRQYPADGRLQFHFGIQPLYGDIDPPPFTREQVVNDLRVLARDIRFECRYRLLHKEPGYGLDPHYRNFLRSRNARMLGYAAKWAVLAMKARELLEGRPYPNTRVELRSRLSAADELAIVDIVDRWSELKPKYEEDPTPLALMLDAFARSLAAWLEAAAPTANRQPRPAPP